MLKVPLQKFRKRVIRRSGDQQRQQNSNRRRKPLPHGGTVKNFRTENTAGQNDQHRQQKPRYIVPDLRVSRKEEQKRKDPKTENGPGQTVPDQTESRQSQRKVGKLYGQNKFHSIREHPPHESRIHFRRMQIIGESKEISELNPVDNQLKRKYRQITDSPRQNEPEQKPPVPQLFPEIPEQQECDQRSEKDVVHPYQTGVTEQQGDGNQSAPTVFSVKQQGNAAEHCQRGKGVAERIEMQDGILRIKVIRKMNV